MEQKLALNLCFGLHFILVDSEGFLPHNLRYHVLKLCKYVINLSFVNKISCLLIKKKRKRKKQKEEKKDVINLRKRRRDE